MRMNNCATDFRQNNPAPMPDTAIPGTLGNPLGAGENLDTEQDMPKTPDATRIVLSPSSVCVECAKLRDQVSDLETQNDLLNERVQQGASAVEDLEARLVEEEALHRAEIDRLTNP